MHEIMEKNTIISIYWTQEWMLSLKGRGAYFSNRVLVYCIVQLI